MTYVTQRAYFIRLDVFESHEFSISPKGKTLTIALPKKLESLVQKIADDLQLIPISCSILLAHQNNTSILTLH